MGKKLKQLLEELREIRNKYLAKQEEVERQLLELCNSQEKELLRQREKDSQVQEELQALSRKLDRMIDKMESQDKHIEQLNGYLKQQNESQKEELARCKDLLEHLKGEKHRLEEEKKVLAEGSCKLKEEKKNLEGEIHGLEEEKKELEEKKEHLEEKVQGLKMEPEIETGRNLYQRYKAWPGKEQLALTELASESFFAFLCNCSSEGQIEYIFNRIAMNLVWEGSDQEGIEIMNEIIDYCITMQNKNGKKLHRQEVKEGDEYNYRLHQKMGDAPNQGYVERVRLLGVEQNGKIYEECRAFVDITNR